MTRDAYYRRKYGITEDDYQALLVSALGGCWVCGRLPTKRRLHVEHDHKTGRIRGLVCWKCNVLLKQASDSPAILRYAAEYLESDEASRILGREHDG